MPDFSIYTVKYMDFSTEDMLHFTCILPIYTVKYRAFSSTTALRDS
ncbi:hypothetical protein HMPREF0373_02000 [Eubacterium ramulus ATCC 29099]|uniref:Uncharacterized protein n=1 Tax=Eubacterium ramulus ATCC 29099 TaxID=1256908 RepID=U2P564_EUBRA|nr:hypothetical protein HMPREF0373_02000 [Eubacterium ramulus ATCC 29099]